MAFRNNIDDYKLHDLGASSPKYKWKWLVFKEDNTFTRDWIEHCVMKI